MGCRAIRDHKDRMGYQERLVDPVPRDQQEWLVTQDLQDHWESLGTQVMLAL